MGSDLQDVQTLSQSFMRSNTYVRKMFYAPFNYTTAFELFRYEGHDLKVKFNFCLVVSKILNYFQNRFTRRVLSVSLLISLYPTDESKA